MPRRAIMHLGCFFQPHMIQAENNIAVKPAQGPQVPNAVHLCSHADSKGAYWVISKHGNPSQGLPRTTGKQNRYSLTLWFITIENLQLQSSNQNNFVVGGSPQHEELYFGGQFYEHTWRMDSCNHSQGGAAHICFQLPKAYWKMGLRKSKLRNFI